MDFTFQNIIYDNSLSRPKDSTQDHNTKEEYPGTSSLLQSLKILYPALELDGRTIKINEKTYILRYRSFNNWSFGNISTPAPYTVFAMIKVHEDQYSMRVIDAEYVRKKTEEKNGSWSIGNDDKNILPAPVTGTTDELNQEIIRIVASDQTEDLM